MKLPELTPEEGVRDRREHFSNWAIAGGEKQHAYVAGRTWWGKCHPSDKGSKPCLLWMTKNHLPCRFCACGKEAVTMGYSPVWRAVDWRPKFVIVYGPEREHIDPLTTHDRVLIAREKGDGESIYVRRCLEQTPKFVTTLAHRMLPQDVADSLLVIWKISELVSWLKCQPVSDNALSLTKAVVVDHAPTESEELYGELVNRIKGRGDKPSQNGKAQPKS